MLKSWAMAWTQGRRQGRAAGPRPKRMTLPARLWSLRHWEGGWHRGFKELHRRGHHQGMSQFSAAWARRTVFGVASASIS